MTGAGKVSDEELLAAVPQATNMRHLLQLLGLAAYGGNYESIRRRLDRLGVLEERFAPRPSRRARPSDDELRAAVTSSSSVANVLRLLGLPEGGGTRLALRQQMQAAGIDTDHFLGQASNRGRSFPHRKRPLDDLLVRGHAGGTDKLRRRLLAEGVLPAVCAGCGGERWNGRPMPLELDHVDGDRTNNALGNLRLLCPNCHAQTDTYRGRNIGVRAQGQRGRSSVDGRARLRALGLQRA